MPINIFNEIEFLVKFRFTENCKCNIKILHILTSQFLPLLASYTGMSHLFLSIIVILTEVHTLIRFPWFLTNVPFSVPQPIQTHFIFSHGFIL